MMPTPETSAREQDPDLAKFATLFTAWEAAANAAIAEEKFGSSDAKRAAESAYQQALAECVAFVKDRAKTMGARAFSSLKREDSIPEGKGVLVDRLGNEIFRILLEEMKT